VCYACAAFVADPAYILERILQCRSASYGVSHSRCGQPRKEQAALRLIYPPAPSMHLATVYAPTGMMVALLTPPMRNVEHRNQASDFCASRGMAAKLITQFRPAFFAA
jgi:hypothetical protein